MTSKVRESRTINGDVAVVYEDNTGFIQRSTANYDHRYNLFEVRSARWDDDGHNLTDFFDSLDPTNRWDRLHPNQRKAILSETNSYCQWEMFGQYHQVNQFVMGLGIAAIIAIPLWIVIGIIVNG
jgi:hypothetical protein